MYKELNKTKREKGRRNETEQQLFKQKKKVS